MAAIKAANSAAGLNRIIDYVTKDEKTEAKLVSGINCNPETVKDEMAATKLLWDKTGGRTYKHFVHSYHAKEKITPEQAHKNALELAQNTKAFEGYEVLVATHIDREHIHSHIIVNSVSFEDGHKLRWSKGDLQNLKDRCNEQSREQGLSVPVKGKTFEGAEREETVANKMSTYQLLKRAEKGEVKSYVQDIALAVLDCREIAESRQDFIQKMQERGYGVEWQDNHKYITFTDLARQQAGEKQCKIRNNKLDMYYNMCFTKERFENEFEKNARSNESTTTIGYRTAEGTNQRIESTITNGTRSIGALHTGNDEAAAFARAAAERKERADRVIMRREREAAEARRKREEVIRRKREAEARERAAAEKRKQQRQENQRTRSRDRDFER